MKRDSKREVDPAGCKYAFFSHTACEYFPCHETRHPKDFNCLFCYCPLYALGERCGGNFTYTDNGVKDCKECMLPHRRENYARVTARFSELAALAKQSQGGGDA